MDVIGLASLLAASLLCHDFFGEGGPPLGLLWAPNLTPAHLAAWSDGQAASSRDLPHRGAR